MPADPQADLLLITCASGKQASALLPLLSQWKRIRLTVNSSSSKDRLKGQYPHAEVIQADLYSPANTASLLKDVNIVLHIGPSYHPHEADIGHMMIDAAVSSYNSGKGPLKHFILSSVLNTQLRKMMNHDCKRYVEEYIIESGLPYTILQPTTFMDNIPVAKFLQEENPTFTAAWDTGSLFSMIALHDLAAATRAVLFEREKHFYAQYPLVGTQTPITFNQFVTTISNKIGKKIEISTADFKYAVAGLCVRLYGTTDVDRRVRDAAERMILFYDGRGLVGNSNVLEWLVGRKGKQVDEWVELKIAEAKGE